MKSIISNISGKFIFPLFIFILLCNNSAMASTFRVGIYEITVNYTLEESRYKVGEKEKFESDIKAFLEDLNELIIPKATNRIIKVHIFDYSEPSTVLGYAMPDFRINKNFESEIVQTNLWHSLNHKIFDFNGLTCRIYINQFHNFSYLNDEVVAGSIDFYTVFMHEFFHCLGKVSYLDQNGKSRYDSHKKGVYSLSDAQLYLSDIDNNKTDLITFSGGFFDWNSNVSPNILTSPLDSIYINQVPISKPAVWDPAASACHIDDNCSAIFPFFIRGEIKRYPCIEDVKFLQAIGYNLTNRFSKPANKERYKEYTFDDYNFPLLELIRQIKYDNGQLKIRDLLYEDEPYLIDFIEIIEDNRNRIVVFPNDMDSILNLGTDRTYLFRMRAKNLNDVKGNLGYGELFPIVECNQDNDNLICNGDFEQTIFKFGAEVIQIVPSIQTQYCITSELLPGWDNFIPSPDIWISPQSSLYSRNFRINPNISFGDVDFSNVSNGNFLQGSYIYMLDIDSNFRGKEVLFQEISVPKSGNYIIEADYFAEFQSMLSPTYPWANRLYFVFDKNPNTCQTMKESMLKYYGNIFFEENSYFFIDSLDFGNTSKKGWHRYSQQVFLDSGSYTFTYFGRQLIPSINYYNFYDNFSLREGVYSLNATEPDPTCKFGTAQVELNIKKFDDEPDTLKIEYIASETLNLIDFPKEIIFESGPMDTTLFFFVEDLGNSMPVNKIDIIANSINRPNIKYKTKSYVQIANSKLDYEYFISDTECPNDSVKLTLRIINNNPFEISKVTLEFTPVYNIEINRPGTPRYNFEVRTLGPLFGNFGVHGSKVDYLEHTITLRRLDFFQEGSISLKLKDLQGLICPIETIIEIPAYKQGYVYKFFADTTVCQSYSITFPDSVVFVDWSDSYPTPDRSFGVGEHNLRYRYYTLNGCLITDSVKIKVDNGTQFHSKISRENHTLLDTNYIEFEIKNDSWHNSSEIFVKIEGINDFRIIAEKISGFDNFAFIKIENENEGHLYSLKLSGLQVGETSRLRASIKVANNASDQGYSIKIYNQNLYDICPIEEYNFAVEIEQKYGDFERIDKSAEKPPLLIYPNPAQNEVTIEFHLENTSEVDLELVDIAGKVLKLSESSQRLPLGTYQRKISLEGISSGSYRLVLHKTILGNFGGIQKTLSTGLIIER